MQMGPRQKDLCFCYYRFFFGQPSLAGTRGCHCIEGATISQLGAKTELTHSHHLLSQLTMMNQGLLPKRCCLLCYFCVYQVCVHYCHCGPLSIFELGSSWSTASLTKPLSHSHSVDSVWRKTCFCTLSESFTISTILLSPRPILISVTSRDGHFLCG